MGREDNHLKGSLGPVLSDLNNLRFQVLGQAQDLLERVADLDIRIHMIERQLAFIKLPEFRTDDDDVVDGCAD